MAGYQEEHEEEKRGDHYVRSRRTSASIRVSPNEEQMGTATVGAQNQKGGS